jgi:UDP-N-acetyl-D-galactosamine dehydrogenase
MNKKPYIAVIGLGYVGYPLALAFGKYFKTIGFDIDQARIQDLRNNIDKTLEADTKVIEQAVYLKVSSDQNSISDANVYVVTISTPVTIANEPDLTEVLGAAEIVGRHVLAGDTVILESTVFPGLTEGVFADKIMQVSGLEAGKDFYLGYSPERINPGDPLHRLQNIVKVISATDDKTLSLLHDIYSRIIPEGVHEAESIKTAELSKLIENTQRDINIAFMNEMFQLAEALSIDFNKVLSCASTKWNFLDFKPGLVGGHCVAVDPYYLLHSQNQLKLPSGMTHTARQTNEKMIEHVSHSFMKEMAKAGLIFTTAKVLIIGVSFKPDCPDMRNSKALCVIEKLMEFGIKPEVFDPVANISKTCGYTVHTEIPQSTYDAILMLVPHSIVIESLKDASSPILKPSGVFYSLDVSHRSLVN